MKILLFFTLLVGTSFGFSQSVSLPDEDASFPGGTAELKQYIQEGKRYPEVSRRNSGQRRVYVTFIVEEDGMLTNIGVMRGGLSVEINADAIRLISGMPNWIPSKVDGVAMRTLCRLPITYNLGGREVRRIRRQQRRNR